ncbi:UNKNOWN [Stylonychia lemnae]|uniref:Uncharacterized protein n=1 Tax=Stylonychia lemnae TaxID=5949 RepID=A0A078AXW0_STYLE|nr:UNKNOWN [Stylonychia lemnae]|eukprot:CDW87285.1 UNKNOWN [Stylonychia lemnae]
MEDHRKAEIENWGKTLLFIIGKFLDAPIERILNIKQSQAYNNQFKTLKKDQFKGYIEITKDIYTKQGGFRQFWRGYPAIGPQALALYIAHSNQVTNGELLYKYLRFIGFEDNFQFTSYLLFQLFNQTALTVLAYPFHLINVKLNQEIGTTQQSRQFVSFKDAFRRLHYQTYDSLGVQQTYYRGVGSFLLTCMIYNQSFSLYNRLVHSFFSKLNKLEQNEQPNEFLKRKRNVMLNIALLMGAPIVTFLSYPFELVYRIQIAIMNQKQKQLNIIETFQDIIKKNGYKGLYNGVVLCNFRNLIFLFMNSLYGGISKKQSKEI